MKANVKKFMAVIAATAMCAVPMTANASGRGLKDTGLKLKTESIGNVKQTSISSKIDPDNTGITIVNGLSTRVAGTGRNMSTCIDPDGTVYTNCTEIVFDRVHGCETGRTPIVPVSTLIGTRTGIDFGKGIDRPIVNKATCVDPDGTTYENCTEITFEETEIMGTYGNNFDRDFLNAYNQIAGHPIKTTTVGVNINK